jgi:hypothetical protein
MSGLQITTLVIAIIGAVLGVLNTWKAFDRDRVRIKVIPQTGVFPELDSGKRILTVQVANLSSFPITISDIGFQLRGTQSDRYRVLPSLDGGGSLPHRLEARSSVAAEFHTDSYNDLYMRRVRRAYAITACGHTFTGTSPSLKQYVNELAKTRHA